MFRTDEGGHYFDTGCTLYPSCLNCPRKHCIDEPEEKARRRRMEQRRKARTIQRLKMNGTATVAIAGKMKCSQRTIQRLAKMRN